MNDYIFREYDIRGEVESDFTEDVVEKIGKAIGTHLARNDVTEMVIGRDCRLSSDRLKKILVKGLVSTGMHIVDIGVCHTPLVYYALFHLEKNGGVMITGSHNPPEFNGFKVCVGKTTIHGREIQALKELIKNNDFVRGEGSMTTQNILPEYTEEISANVAVSKRLKVVVDAGNGTGGLASVPVLKRLGCDVIELHCAMDGNFPNHHPDPTIPANLKELIETVKKEKADLGLSYDGDADRIGVVDEKGNIIWGDRLMIIFAREILKELPGATFVSEVKASQQFYDDVNGRGGKAIMWKAGHSLIKAKMKEQQAVLGGEMSGHIFFSHRYYGFDDAVYASCRLIEILSKTEGPLSDLLADVPETFTTPEIRVDCPDDKKFQIIEEVRKRFRNRYELIEIDGARIIMPGGWALVRASNTQPVLVMRFEADAPDRLEEIKKEVSSFVNTLL